MFKELYNFRELLKTNVKKEIRGKYKGSFLGILWSFVNPLLSVLVYAIVFPFILKDTQPNYVTFLIIGILPWTWFTTSIVGGTNCITINGGIIKKVYFPREILPISIVTSGLVNYLISCTIILIFVLFGGVGIGYSIIALPLVMIVQYILQLGILFITSAINVYVKDAEYLINFFVTLLFYATPVLYSSTLFPEKYRWILNLNPMTTIINSYRNIFYNKIFPNFYSLGIIFLVSLSILVIGYIIFKKLERRFAEEV